MAHIQDEELLGGVRLRADQLGGAARAVVHGTTIDSWRQILACEELRLWCNKALSMVEGT